MLLGADWCPHACLRLKNVEKTGGTDRAVAVRRYCECSGRAARPSLAAAASPFRPRPDMVRDAGDDRELPAEGQKRSRLRRLDVCPSSTTPPQGLAQGTR